ncbi:UNVERIFIED_CONTAM: hypothetical protein Sradi_4028700 [Sesamum radiatum]|uniref:Uncharacterized protein n=1 Tax=Sesamum radiatum TaxID=300843 RepID=A0AAW2PL54_SESRA
MFKSQIGSTMEVYVNDMLVKSKEEDHLRELKRAFGVMRDYGMKLNPDKCTFGVRGGKFLGYMISKKGIEANLEKIQAIIGLRSPRTLNEMQKLTGPDGVEIEVAARLSFPTTNNEAEYEALVLGLQLALEAGVKEVNVCTDSQLLAMQVEGSYETREQTMVQYLKKVKELMTRFDKCIIQQIPRTENERADVLSKFGAMIVGVKERKIALIIKEHPVIEEREELQAIENNRLWKVEFMNYLKEGILPDNPIKARRLKFKATRFTIIGNDLYKRTIDGPLLKCLDEKRAQYVLREIHEGSCGNHSSGRSLAQKVCWQGYFWPTLVKDATEFARKCESCQRFGSLIHTPATPMEPIRIACPFDQWGIDIVGPFPQAIAQKKFILVAVEYISKWVEVEALAKITKKEMINFIWKNIICRFGIPRVLISNNGTQFQGKAITAWCKELKI